MNKIMNIQRIAAICAIGGVALFGLPAASHAAGAAAMSRTGYAAQSNIEPVSATMNGLKQQGGCREKEMWGPSKRPEVEQVCTGRASQ
ncbi:hypothetical protein [Granulibacter bethesdensis]|uniref:hypothetical protein n=1 Tax=Granulibacter bethesdensis TaxID=364410 RepID=UPI0003F208BB|nr:hypothetical protein [Granulibacter bethesdensis]AHJ66455.1 putative secreted protein [Granulibacter bethesdensis CGDNIH4]